MSSPRYYLETCAIRELSPHLQKLKGNSFTSYWTVQELISGITNEEEYNRRSNILKKLQRSEIRVDWRTPIEMIAQAFPVLTYHETIADELRILYQLTIQCKDCKEFLKYQLTVSKGVQFFIQLDQRMNDVFKENATKESERYRATKEQFGGKVDLRPARSAGLDAIKEFLIGVIRGPRKPTSTELVYNDGINIFLRIVEQYYLPIMAKSDLPRRNDWTDMHHSLYLESDPEIKLVSNDAGIKQKFDPIYPQGYCSIEDLKRLMCLQQ